MDESLRLFTERLAPSGSARATLELVLPFERRQKARQRARTAAGHEVGIQLPRGTVLRGGDRLRAADGTLLAIVAAPEAVSTVASDDLRELARVAYHLGNRHVALQIGAGWVRYLRDHVLDAMVEQLGLQVRHDTEPFEPEAGAYGSHAHAHHAHGTLGPHTHAPAGGGLSGLGGRLHIVEP
jgi:urease accessory protein